MEITRNSLKEHLSSDTQKLLDLADKLGQKAIDSRNNGLQVSKHTNIKGFVTSGDVAVDQLVYSEASIRFPGVTVLSEETQTDFIPSDNPDVLIVDPIDGTRWYKDGGEVWSINLSLVNNGELKSAVIVQPDLRVITFAEKGLGAYCQKGGKIEQIFTNSETDLRKSKVGVGMNFADYASAARISELLKPLCVRSRGLNIMESSGYELVCLARGAAISAYIHPDAKPWDKSAGMLIINEAGGRATGWPGRDEIFGNGVIAAANQELYAKVAELAMEHVR